MGVLDGITALVTGGGSGIGLACATRLAQDGAIVTVAGRTAAKLEQTGFRHVVCDVADEEAVQAAVAYAAEPSGGLGIAVANAGTGGFGPIVSMAREQWQSVLDTNLTGTFLTFKHAAASMMGSGGGAIVAVSSIAGPLTHRFMSSYCVSKAGIETLVRNAADELGVHNIRVNGVRPGLVPTDLSGPLVGAEDIRADYLAQMPVRRLGTPEDVAEAVRYLTGPESSWVTGQLIAVDGGHTLRRGPDLETAARMMFGDQIVGPRPE